jgi:hypothetical protein
MISPLSKLTLSMHCVQIISILPVLVIVSPLLVHGRVIPGKLHYFCFVVNPSMYIRFTLKIICLVLLSYPRHNLELHVLIDMKRYLFTNVTNEEMVINNIQTVGPNVTNLEGYFQHR